MTTKHTPESKLKPTLKSTLKRTTRQPKSATSNPKADPFTMPNENSAATAARILSSKRASMKFLQEAGIATRSGKLNPHLDRK